MRTSVEGVLSCGRAKSAKQALLIRCRTHCSNLRPPTLCHPAHSSTFQYLHPRLRLVQTILKRLPSRAHLQSLHRLLGWQEARQYANIVICSSE